MTFYLTDRSTNGSPAELAIAGELDLHAAPEIKASLHDAIADGARHLVLDLSDATFIDSTTIGVLVGTRKRLNELGGSLHVACANEHVLAVFEMAGLAEALDVHETPQQARAAALEAA
jgi:anti-sigma B factor antagonist